MLEAIMTYGYSHMSHKLLASELAYWRTCCGVTLLDYVRNAETRKWMAAEKLEMDTYGKKKDRDTKNGSHKDINDKRGGQKRQLWRSKSRHIHT